MEDSIVFRFQRAGQFLTEGTSRLAKKYGKITYQIEAYEMHFSNMNAN
jgi:hypothetical protein